MSGEVGDDLLRRYIHHQDHNIRFVAANKVLGINSGYIGWRSPGGKVRKKLVLEFLRSKDPRVRRAMFAAINEILRRRSEEHTSELQSRRNLVCRLLLEKKKEKITNNNIFNG